MIMKRSIEKAVRWKPKINGLSRLRNVNSQVDVVKLLKEKKLSNTPVRRALLSVLSKSQKPLSIQELLENLKPVPDPTTLYRNMVHLENAGIITRVKMSGQAEHFELIRAGHHHHVVCRECESVSCVDVCIPSILSKEVSRLGFRNIEHQLQFSGVCQNCSLAP
jgi:Fur family ferric uptake transcriptional regulator